MKDKIFPAGSEYYLVIRYYVAMLNSSPTLATIIKYKDGSWGVHRGNRTKAHNFKYIVFPMRITERRGVHWMLVSCYNK